ncbi:ImmA/IrrE family metallo-endopeptidase [Mesorhizobium sp.]|uniref:ImmA/IrrE family metallo-endopeptidase n=1 Tax=Mesorhizobium sp. TaxID=1871066 RepID=UPI000FE526D9|nr:ImmA/IrrE family metallo-endopeptidase [Mesorhizobium sp.]RWK53161.1 MAG: ImmA/IrrE family metallo-endopeptidase [Mesorhizobium sp.]TIP43524.1 MAG: ImmA/IrrE family metallo-endopeptidase [Mesorhizobium sp.]
MRRPDDSSLTPQQYAKVRSEAERALREAGALGVFPTPIADIMVAAKLEEVQEDVLNEGFLASMRRKAGAALKSALSKVIGLFDARAKLVFIDRTLHVVKQAFVRLHETGHGFMAWQKDLYAIVEDCEQTIDPEIADLFDREANTFASEVMFQLDTFTEEAEQKPFGIMVPVRLSSRYGGSIYAAVRRYVFRNHRACVVLVLNPPELIQGDGFRASIRRVVASPRFTEIFGSPAWPVHFTPSDEIGAVVPIGKRRASGKRTFALTDRNGDRHECIIEAFTQTHQVFVLIHSVSTLTRTTIILPGNTQ